MAIQYPQLAPSTGSASINPNRFQIPGAVTGSPGRPMYGPNGVIIDSASGQPFTGVYNNTHVKNGVQLQLNPVSGTWDTPDNIAQSNAQIQNDPSKRYAAVNIPKNPDVAAATSDLLDTFKKTADSSLKDFSDYLTNFKTDVGAARDAGKAATDITGTTTNLRNYQANYNTALDSSQQQYRSALDAGQSRENQIVKQAQDTLPQYDAAAQNVADRQQQVLQQQVGRYKLASGTPTGMGSDELKILAQGTQDIQLPTQLAKIQRQYDVMGNYALPVARDITGQNTAYAGSFLPSIAGSAFGANTGVENQLQNLKMQVANMSFDDATRYMQSIGIPWNVQSQILSGNISNLGGLNALESGSRYQGLQDKLGVNVSQPQNFNFSAPPMPTYSTGYPAQSRYPVASQPTVTATNGGVPASSPDPMQYLSNIGMPGFPNQNQIYPSINDYVDGPAVNANAGSYFA